MKSMQVITANAKRLKCLPRIALRGYDTAFIDTHKRNTYFSKDAHIIRNTRAKNTLKRKRAQMELGTARS